MAKTKKQRRYDEPMHIECTHCRGEFLGTWGMFREWTLCLKCGRMTVVEQVRFSEVAEEEISYPGTAIIERNAELRRQSTRKIQRQASVIATLWWLITVGTLITILVFAISSITEVVPEPIPKSTNEERPSLPPATIDRSKNLDDILKQLPKD
jgi:hypothetical protein